MDTGKRHIRFPVNSASGCPAKAKIREVIITPEYVPHRSVNFLNSVLLKKNSSARAMVRQLRKWIKLNITAVEFTFR